MKVRNILGGAEFEVVEAIVVKDRQGILHTVEKAVFEEVPSDRWRDVTGECEVIEDTHIRHRDVSYCAVGPGYRLRKVQRYKYGALSMPPTDAFIVEKKC